MIVPPSRTDLALARVRAAIDRRVARVIRRARLGPRVHSERFTLRSTVGYQLQAAIHIPPELQGPAPAVVLCPGIDDAGSVFTDWSAPIHADELARAGFITLRFDPAGRGESWGEEDFGGPEHQDDVASVVRYLAGHPQVDPERIGLLAISLGVAMATGAAAHEDIDVAWLVDWEGPCDREIITAGGRIMAPAAGHAMEDEVYWAPREAVRHVGLLRCPYVRLQAQTDHAQPGELRHARRMIHAASQGQLPWFQLNDHPRGEVPDRPRWLRDDAITANRTILRKLNALRDVRAQGGGNKKREGGS